MTTKRTNVLAGAVLGGLLILGTAGLVLGADPTSSPSASPTQGMSGDMMGGQGMMGGMDADQMPDMSAMHETMAAGGTCDAGTMQAMHEQSHSTR